MNDRSIIQAPEPGGRGAWIDAYMPENQLVAYQPRPQLINMALIRGILFRQRWLIAGVIAAAVVGGLVLTLLATPLYLAESKVRVQPYGSYILEGQDVETRFAGTNQVYDYLSTMVEVLRSRNLAETIAADLNLGTRYDLLGKDIDESRPPNMSDAQWLEAKQKRAASILADSVSTEVPSNNWVITIGFVSENPVIAAEMANAYSDAFAASDTRNSASSNEYAREYLQQQIQETRAKLSEAEQAANLYARNTGIIVEQFASTEEGSGSSTLTGANLSGINQRVAAARAARIEAEQRWRSIQNLPASQLPEVQGNPVLQGLLTDRTNKRAQLADLRQRYNDDFPQIVTLLAQIQVLDGQIERSSADIKATVRNNFVIAQNQEAALQAELSSVTGQRLVEQDKQVEYDVLEREAQALRDQLKTLLDRFNQVSSAANVDTSSITKLDSAIVPTEPFSPNLMRNLGFALVLGIGLAAGLAVLRETLDDRIRSLDDIEDKIGLSLLGHTPHVEERDIEVDGSNRFSALMEAYSSIRAAIDFTLPRNRNVLMLTSSQASEGKSTTAVILAELFASLGRKTLLIDADLRRPSVARLLDIERPKVGLVEVLLGHVELDDAIVKGVHENLEILPIGEIPPNPTEILASKELREFIEKNRDQYGLILFDSCPVMGLADAPMLSRLVDGTIFVLEANKVPFAQARAAVRRVKSAGGHLTGVILTKYRALEAGQAYGYQYGYYQYDSEKR